MAVTSWIRRQFNNGVITTATSTMTSGATSFTVNTGAGSTFPDGSVGPFIVTVDQGQAAEEKILITSRSTDTFTVAASGRGYNGTTAQAHTNASVLHTIDKQDLDEANQVAHQTLGAIAASGDLLQGSAANTLVKLSLGTTGQLLVAGASSAAWSNTPNIVGTSGLTGATASSRYVGATASGAPGSGTFSTGDFIIDQTGVFWICTSGGSPGTWNLVGGLSDAAWTAVLGGIGFTNSWSNAGGGPGGFAAGYRKLNGRIYLRGSISGGNPATSAFTLPAGYRPSAAAAFYVLQTGGVTGTDVVIGTGGTVTPNYSGAAGTSVVDLGAISFDVL